ncbi:hypothetical protein [Granulosicoccus antarcticus]|uniref:Uncharacterized protein n=1 Tax=Granulosicoccus antarcticus IMCC3135 TaxID=1192854 RepID=A0A2Z2NY81_9GAMM|nr:hypothetical protein [Granulosicoccus antarcticus]ASJ72104.1 hypothetical protein IMCC3135_10050 [Granulosicoccus antarcticus IMCC3135]
MVVNKNKSLASTKKRASKKKVATKASSKKKNTNKTLKWDVPGYAKATLFFKSPRTKVYVELSPTFDGSHSVDALIGDEVTEDDILDIEGFDSVLLSTDPKQRFVNVLLVNWSGQDVDVDLAFMFVGTNTESGAKYTFSISSNDSFSTSIPVAI